MDNMKQQSSEHPLCREIALAFDLLGKKWTGPIIHVLMEGPMYFNEIERSIPELSSKMLTTRMKELESRGIVTRTVLDESPIRVEYELTEKGYGLKPIFEEIERWAERFAVSVQAER